MEITNRYIALWQDTDRRASDAVIGMHEAIGRAKVFERRLAETPKVLQCYHGRIFGAGLAIAAVLGSIAYFLK